MRSTRHLAVAVAALAAVAGATAPPIVSWHDAGDHVGELVTVEGDVVAARTGADGCVLEFSSDDPRAFRVVLLVPLLTDLPRQPERLYRGRRVRATGRVQRFRGRPEMVLHDPGQLEVVDVAGAGGAPPAQDQHQAAPPETRAPPETTAPPEAAPSPTPAEVPLAAPNPCQRARARWQDAGATARARLSALSRCLEGTSYRCRVEAAALEPALSELEWAEQQVEAACP